MNPHFGWVMKMSIWPLPLSLLISGQSTAMLFDAMPWLIGISSDHEGAVLDGWNAFSANMLQASGLKLPSPSYIGLKPALQPQDAIMSV